jgi:asparagine synthase (glutamine-hydrolysing)
MRNLHRLAGHLDEPIMDANNYTLMAICEGLRSRSDLKVALCGEGSDELFAGYERYSTIASRYTESGDPDTLVYAYNAVALPRLALFADDAGVDVEHRRRLADRLRSTDPVNKLLELDQLTFLLTRLQSQDRVGMMFGLEIRPPFLDHPLNELANRLPPALKIRDGFSKWILRRVNERHLPAEIAWNRRKTALSAPVARMFGSGPLRIAFLDLIDDRSRVASYYSAAGMKRLLQMHDPSRNGHDHSNTLWRILALELWLRSFE